MSHELMWDLKWEPNAKEAIGQYHMGNGKANHAFRLYRMGAYEICEGSHAQETTRRGNSKMMTHGLPWVMLWQSKSKGQGIPKVISHGIRWAIILDPKAREIQS